MATVLKMTPGIASDPDKPQFVFAPSPDNPREHVRLFVNPETIRQMLRDSRNAGLGQYAGLVHGEARGQTEAGEFFVVGSGGLMRAVGLFRGIKRPCVDHEVDKSVHVYVTNPRVDFIWPESRRFTALGPERRPPPKASVFVTFAVFDAAAIDKEHTAIAACGGGQVDGIIHNWEWTLASPQDPRFPDEFDARYDERVWVL